MRESTKYVLELSIKGIENAGTIESHNCEHSHIMGMLSTLELENLITPAEKSEINESINKAEENYWEKAKGDYASAHRRIFPVK